MFQITTLLLICIQADLLLSNIVPGVPIEIEDIRKDIVTNEVFRETVNLYNQQLNSHYSFAPYKIHKAIKRIFVGIYYEFEVTMVGTKCRNKPDRFNQILANCGINEEIRPLRVRLEIYGIPLLKPFAVNVASSKEEKEITLHDQLFVVGLPDDDSFKELDLTNFMVNYGKTYQDDNEKVKRFSLLKLNAKKATLMQFLEKGSAEHGLTQFSDLTEEEFTKLYLSPAYDISKKPTRLGQIPQDIRVPQAIDWRTLGAVTPVKNQGQCGSCWAFSTTGNIEGQWFIKNKKLISLSEQQLVDCDTIDEGCNGGLPSQAYKAIQQMGGLERENDYPYSARRDTCTLNKSKLAVYINGSESISTSESDMADWCAINGPISIGINAFAMQFYRGGISHPYSFFCNPSHLDHGVLIVGFNKTTSGEPFWTIKNSWGSSWGENGYYRVFRGSGVCGLNKMPTSSIVYAR